MNRAREKLVKLATKHGLDLRQGFPRVDKLALLKHQRYAHAKQFKRARCEQRRLRTVLGRVMRDIERKLKDKPGLEPLFRPMLFLAGRVHAQERGQRSRRVYSLHAPEVECIGKGKAHKPYEFGVKVSIATTVQPSRGGQCVLAAKALPVSPYDGHTLSMVLRTSSGPSATRLSASSRTRAIAAAACRRRTACASSSPSKAAASPQQLSGSSGADQPSSP